MSERRLGEKSFGELEKDVARSGRDEQVADALREQTLDRLRQANRLRERFYLLAAVLASATVATSVLLVLGYVVVALVHGHEIPSVVAVGFITGLAVETIAVLAIMAGYLFPRDRGAED